MHILGKMLLMSCLVIALFCNVHCEESLSNDPSTTLGPTLSGSVFETKTSDETELTGEFLPTNSLLTSSTAILEQDFGSGDGSNQTGDGVKLTNSLNSTSSFEDETTTADGSGDGFIKDIEDNGNNFNDFDYTTSDDDVHSAIPTTEEPFVTTNFNDFLNSYDDTHTTEDLSSFITIYHPSIFQGQLNWHDTENNVTSLGPKLPSNSNEVTTDRMNAFDDHGITSSHPDESSVINETIEKSKKSSDLQTPRNGTISVADAFLTKDEPKKTSVGTYICLAILAVILVGLIGFAIVKSQLRKRRDRKSMRQQRKDIEKADKEMVDMNTSLLGKSAPAPLITERKVNGKYELVPTHEKSNLNKTGNGSVEHNLAGNGTSVIKENNNQINPNKTSTEDDVLIHSKPNPKQTSQRDSLASAEIDFSQNNGINALDVTPPLTGDHDNSNLLQPREYVPVYSPDMGRVRITVSETPKPKTPTLVTRSRSNAGEIIITPVGEQQGSEAT